VPPSPRGESGSTQHSAEEPAGTSRYEPALRLDQQFKYVEGTISDVHRLAVDEHFTAREVDIKRSDADHGRIAQARACARDASWHSPVTRHRDEHRIEQNMVRCFLQAV
jgi:hypothetical protein